MSANDLCRKHGISDATFYKWRSRFGGKEISEARKLKALEDENRKLKKPEALFIIHPTSRSRDSFPDGVTSHDLAQASANLARTDTRVVDLLHQRTGYDRGFFEAQVKSEEPLREDLNHSL